MPSRPAQRAICLHEEPLDCKSLTYSTVTTVIAISDYGNCKYDIKEVAADEPSFPELHSGNRKQIEFSLPVPGLAVRLVDKSDEDLDD